MVNEISIRESKIKLETSKEEAKSW
jgi:hypothetical protein